MVSYLFKIRQELAPVATKVAQDMQSIPETVDGDAVSRIKLLYEFDEVLLRVGQSEIFEPVRRVLIWSRRASVKGIQVIEQQDRKAARWGTVLRKVRESVQG